MAIENYMSMMRPAKYAAHPAVYPDISPAHAGFQSALFSGCIRIPSNYSFFMYNKRYGKAPKSVLRSRLLTWTPCLP